MTGWKLKIIFLNISSWSQEPSEFSQNFPNVVSKNVGLDPLLNCAQKLADSSRERLLRSIEKAVEADLKAEPAMMLVEEILGWLKPYIK